MSSEFVTNVNIFPIKSCQAATAEGVEITELAVAQTGFGHEGVADRQWVLVEESGLFVSQRGWNEKQAKVHSGDSKLATVAIDIRQGYVLVSTPEHGEITLASEMEVDVSRSSVRVHDRQVEGVAEDDEAGQFFSDLLGRAVKLVRADKGVPTAISAAYTREGASNAILAADSLPFLLTSQSSLNHLHELAGIPLGTVPLSRYRANIEIDGAAWGSFAEDNVTRLSIGHAFDALVAKACSRCPIPNIDQQTGESDRLSTKLLARHRTGWRATEDPQTDRPQQYFGQNLNHFWDEEAQGTVAVGDPVEIMDIGNPNVTLKSR